MERTEVVLELTAEDAAQEKLIIFGRIARAILPG